MTLKDGTHPVDPRLGRIPKFDPKSRNYRVGIGVQNFVPRSFTWNFLDPYVINQGQEGACVWFAFGNELRCKPRPIPFSEQACREHYWMAQREDDWEGGAYPGADPFYEGTSVLAGAKIGVREGFYREYRWAFSERELAWAVSHKGPAVIGVNWYEKMSRPDTYGCIVPAGELLGGHAILVRGYSIRSESYLLRNSWGNNWGRNGDCYLSRWDMEQLLHEGGEACIPVGRR